MNTIFKLKKQKFLNLITNDKFLVITTLLIFMKSALFVSITNTTGASSIDIKMLALSIILFFIYLPFIFIFTSFTYLINFRKRIYVLILINVLFTILFLGDLCYYRGFSNYLNFYLFEQTVNLGEGMGGSILSLFRPIDTIFILDIILQIVHVIKTKASVKNTKKSIKSFFFTLVASLSIITISHLIIDNTYNPILPGASMFRRDIDPHSNMLTLGPVGYHIFDGYNFYKDSKKLLLSEDEKTEIESWFEKNRKLSNLPDNEYAGIFKNKNLLLIQVESLENFVINQKFNGKEITPVLNSLLANSLYFDNYNEQVYGGTSSDCDFLTTTSMYPVRSGATFFEGVNKKFETTLPKIFDSMGYYSQIIHPDKALFWNYKPMHENAIGFKHTVFTEDMNVYEHVGHGISDKNYFEEALYLMNTKSTPWLTYTVTLTNHQPFNLPDSLRELDFGDKEELRESYLGNYLDSIYYSDKQIGNFLSKLENKGLLSNTVVVIYGDHTGVHKYYSDKIQNIDKKESWMKNKDKEVPLIIYSKELEGKTISTYGGQVDLLPTLSYLFGADKDSYKYAMGRNLINTDKNFAILANRKMIGDFTDEDEEFMKEGMKLSDKIIRSDYFNNK